MLVRPRRRPLPTTLRGALAVAALACLTGWSWGCADDLGQRSCDSDDDCRHGRACVQGYCLSTDLYVPDGGADNTNSNTGNNNTGNNNTGNNNTGNNNTGNNSTPNGDRCPPGQIFTHVEGIEGCYQLCQGERCGDGQRCVESDRLELVCVDAEEPVQCVVDGGVCVLPGTDLPGVCHEGQCAEGCFDDSMCPDDTGCWRRPEETLGVCVEPSYCSNFTGQGDDEGTRCRWQWSCIESGGDLADEAIHKLSCKAERDDGLQISECECEVGDVTWGEFEVEGNLCQVARDITGLSNEFCGWNIRPSR